MSKIAISCRDDRVYEFSPESTALLSIDFQQEFLSRALANAWMKCARFCPGWLTSSLLQETLNVK